MNNLQGHSRGNLRVTTNVFYFVLSTKISVCLKIYVNKNRLLIFFIFWELIPCYKISLQRRKHFYKPDIFYNIWLRNHNSHWWKQNCKFMLVGKYTWIIFKVTLTSTTNIFLSMKLSLCFKIYDNKSLFTTTRFPYKLFSETLNSVDIV